MVIARWSILASGLLGVASFPSAAQSTPDPTVVDLLPLEEEVALALSAAPAHLREGATVWALTEHGWVEAQEGANGFACAVNRDHPLNRKPTCYDVEGAETILPKVKYMSELLLEGVSMAAVRDSIQAGFASGRFIAPRRSGVAYMLTKGIRTYNPNNGQFGTFPPHLMFYGPDLTNEDVGVSFPARQQKPWLPFVAYQGPHGFMIVVIGDEGADP